jgi:hypothetical protein
MAHLTVRVRSLELGTVASGDTDGVSPQHPAPAYALVSARLHLGRTAMRLLRTLSRRAPARTSPPTSDTVRGAANRRARPRRNSFDPATGSRTSCRGGPLREKAGGGGFARRRLCDGYASRGELRRGDTPPPRRLRCGSRRGEQRRGRGGRNCRSRCRSRGKRDRPSTTSRCSTTSSKGTRCLATSAQPSSRGQHEPCSQRRTPTVHRTRGGLKRSRQQPGRTPRMVSSS